MEEKSLFWQLKQLESYVNRAIVLPEEPSTAMNRAVAALRQNAALARALIRDYELLEDDPRKQAAILPHAIERLENMRDGILLISQYDLVGPVDVAQFTAQIEHMIERLR